MDIAQRIEKRLKTLKKSERQASLEANLSESFIRNIRLGRSTNPRIDTLARLAKVLKTSVEWLCNGEGEEKVESIKNENTGFLLAEPNVSLINFVDFSEAKKMVVYGQAIGGDDGLFEFNGTPIYDVICPPNLQNCNGAYAITVCGSSMSPRYEDGEIAYVDPTRPIKRGDYVVVQVQRSATSGLEAYIKKYVSRNSKELILEQFNPSKELRFPINMVSSVHYVVMGGSAK